MAGSYSHCDDNGSFSFHLIENLGDAQEACEMMHFMIQYLSQNDPVLIKQAEDAYYFSITHECENVEKWLENL